MKVYSYSFATVASPLTAYAFHSPRLPLNTKNSIDFRIRYSATNDLKLEEFTELRPIQDPLGLYPIDGEERKSGRIQSSELNNVEVNKEIYDPLNIYSESSEERLSGRVKALEPKVKVIKAVVDPMAMYPYGAPIDDDAVMSEALPFMTRPICISGDLPGDSGFDPLGFVKSNEDLMNYREAEIKHARLAMLAVAGWPLSELFNRNIAMLLHLNPLLDKGDRVPSLLNGGLEKINPFYWMACFGAAAAIEFYGLSKKNAGDESYFPGNLDFDPLGFYPQSKDGRRRMQLAEIKNGRLAMIAIVGFAIQEFILKIGIVDETPLFFFPWWQQLNIM